MSKYRFAIRKHLMTCRLLLSIVVSISFGWLASCDAAGSDSLSGSVAGPGGMVVVVGYEVSSSIDEVCKKEGFTVQILESDPAKVAIARERIDELECATKASVMEWSGQRLPQASNLVNVVLVPGALKNAPSELMRILAPRGSAIVSEAENRQWLSGLPYPVSGVGSGFVKFTKPVPASIDDWTHYLHDASGNAVADDHRVGPPANMQWCVDSGGMTRDHDGLASVSSMVSRDGRMFYIFDEGPTSLIHRPPQWNLIARDAFNGVVLWKRSISDWVTHLYFFRSGPTWLPRRLVAVEDKVCATLGLEEPISALDAESGRALLTFQGTEKTEEFVVHDKYLLAVTGDPAKANREAEDPFLYTEFTIDDQKKVSKRIVACDLESGDLLWKVESANLVDLAPLSLCAHGDRVFYVDSANIHCLGITDGKEQWKAPFTTKGLFLRSYAPTVVATKDALLCLTNDRLAAFASDDGRLLWEKSGYVGFASPGDLFVIDDLVWTLPTVATLGSLRPEGGEFLGNDGREFLGIEILTGKIVAKFDRGKVWPSGHHHRCYRNKATSDYFICGRRGVEFVGIEDDSVVHNWWIRGICQYGIMPANGLLYVPPDPCRCFDTIKMNGLLAFTSGDKSFSAEGPARVKGPAYSGDGSRGKSTVKHEPSPSSWPTYRHDMQRSGFTPNDVSRVLDESWKQAFDGRVSAVTVSDGAVYIAEIDAHKLHCLDSDSGQTRWSFAVASRIDSPPTIYRGMAMFGCRDGWVRALRVTDGELVWKFRAAPQERFIAEDGQFESAWPVSGSVLVVDDVVYFAAGRSTFLHDGIVLCGLDPMTGEQVHRRVMASREVSRSMGSPGQSPGVLPAILCSNGNTIAMRSHQFLKNLESSRKGNGHILLARTDFLDDSWFHRTNWSVAGGRIPPWGKLIVFNEQRAFGVQNPYTYVKRTPGLWHEGQRGHHHQQYSLYERDRFPRGVRFHAQPLNVEPRITPVPIATTDHPDHKRWEKAGESSIAHHLWTHTLPMQIRAMVLSGDTVFAAGWRDSQEMSPGAAELPGADLENTPALYVFNAEDGKALRGYQLPARPVFDGMAAAEGKLFVPLADGTLICFKGQENDTATFDDQNPAK